MTLPSPSSVLDTLQGIPAGTWVTAGAAGIVAFLAGLAFARGVVKQLFGMVSLGLAVLVAYYVFSHRSTVFGSAGATMSSDKLMIFSASAGLLTYFVCRFLIHILAGVGLLNILGGLTGWKGLMVSLVPSGFMLWVSTLVLRLTGTVFGMETAADARGHNPAAPGAKADAPNAFTTWLHQLSQQIDRSTLGALAEKFDPLDLRATANLSRLLILWPDGTVWNQLAAQNAEAGRMLNHPKLVALGKDPKVRQAIERQDFAGLMQLP
ncbi:MAG TPA: CvpA family protein, partial [Prosthecobacter sp.]|nr:CvpA family protein [Prosthecobacter sp.]